MRNFKEKLKTFIKKSVYIKFLFILVKLILRIMLSLLGLNIIIKFVTFSYKIIINYNKDLTFRSNLLNNSLFALLVSCYNPEGSDIQNKQPSLEELCETAFKTLSGSAMACL